MRVLVYGGGGREHALAWKLSRSKIVEKIFLVNPNPLMKDLGEEIKNEDFDFLALKAKSLGVDTLVVGPELPLSQGIVNAFHANGIASIGPERSQAWLESSKSRAKEFNDRNSIPTASWETIEKNDQIANVLQKFSSPYVLKADGLAGGKGVCICKSYEEACEEAERMLKGKFGESSRKVVVEEYLEGKELSAICLYDGKKLLNLDFARDHKKLLDGDKGPNTGGMGAYSPVEMEREKRESVFEVLHAVEKGLKREGIHYHGVLYVGMMLTKNGAKVLEYNVRFGDPETQCLMVRMKSDLGKVFQAVVNEKLDEIKLEWGEASNALVIASQGYPFSPRKGKIENLEEAKKESKVEVFGGAISLEHGELFSNGGRVLTVVAVGENAHEKTLHFAERLKFPLKFYRKDIGF